MPSTAFARRLPVGWLEKSNGVRRDFGTSVRGIHMAGALRAAAASAHSAVSG